MNRADAEELTGRIRQALDHAWPEDLLTQAWETGAWKALGYPKWEAYVATEFVISLIRVPRGERRQAAVRMASVGMSTEAIGAALGVNQSTIARDLSGDADALPEKIAGLDGKTYTRWPQGEPDRSEPRPDRVLYEAQLSAPICAPVVLREEKLDSIKQWGWSGTTLVDELSFDEAEVMLMAADEIVEKLELKRRLTCGKAPMSP